MTRFVSPLNILCASWALTFGLAGVALAAPTTFDLLPELLWREDIDLARFTWTGAVWLCIALGTYAMADQITALVLRLRPSPHVAPPPVQLGRIVFWVNAAMFVILLLWIALAARKTGGPAGLIALAQTDALAARDVLLDGKLFPGMRLVYAGLSGTGALAMAALALPGARYEKRLALAVILVNGALLL
ncbi:MAG: hypothetical protein HRU30_12770, partial [Rhodobacteraceae bacterium]|nr:hypothetical protein [Paracoccaceae bacterium]